MDLLVHQEKKATQAPMEKLEMMVILVNLDVMVHLEGALTDQGNL